MRGGNMANLIVNGGFDSLFAGWTVGSTEQSPFPASFEDGLNLATANSTSGSHAWYLRSSSSNYFGTPIPIISGNSAFNGFDGSGGNFFLQQNFALPAGVSTATLSFAFAALSQYSGLQRTFDVNILNASTGANIANLYHYIAPFGDYDATITTVSLNIASVLAGLSAGTYTLQFLETIPESFTGPANFVIDSIALDVTANTNHAPARTGSLASLSPGLEDTGYIVTKAQLLTGYTDADNDTLAISGLAASNGTVTDNLNGTFTITPTANYNGAVTLSYTISDGKGGSVAASLGYTLAAVNDAPKLTDAVATLVHGTEDNSYTVTAANLLAGFTDVDRDTLSVTNLAASHATITDNHDGTFTIVPDADYNGIVNLTYTVSDGHGGAVAATQSVTLDAVNDAPALTGSPAALVHGTEDAHYTVTAADLLAGFTDVDHDTLSIAGIAVSNGTITDNHDGTYTITPAADFNGAVTLTYSVTDGHGGSVGATQSYSVDAVNDAPALTGIPGVLAHGTEDTAYTVTAADLIAGFTDVDHDALSVTNLAASHATVTDNHDGTFTIAPDADYNGLVELTYSVSDGHGGSAAATQNVTLYPVNDAPALTGTPATLAHGTEDTPYSVTATDLLAGFTDVDHDTLSIADIAVSNGTITDNQDGTYAIVTDADFNGAVVLTYTVSDGNGGSVVATQTFTVDAVNDAPKLTDAQATLAHGTEDTPYTVTAASLLAGFTDVDHDTLSITDIAVSNGALTENSDGTYTIVPTANFNGTVTLSYTVDDGHGGSIAATQSYSVVATNDAPALTGGQATLVHGTEDTAYTVSAADLLAGFTDVEHDSLSVTGLAASNGTITDNHDGTYTVTTTADFNGAVTLTYSVTDGNGGTVETTQGFTVDAVNDAPRLVAAAALAHGTEDTAYTVSTASLLAGFADPEGDKLSLSGLTASNGTLTDNHDGTFTVTPPADFNGAVTLSYTVADGHGGVTPASASYTVDNVNDAPRTLVLDKTTLAENSIGGTRVATASAFDIDSGDTLRYALTNNANGRFTIDAATGVISVAAGAALDYETTKSLQIGVRVTDAAGTSLDKAFTLALTDQPDYLSKTGTGKDDRIDTVTFDHWTVNGLGGNDTITTHSGNDVVNGGNGNDIISTGSGDDTIRVDASGGYDTVLGGTGTDTIVATGRGVAIGLAALSGIEVISAGGFSGIEVTGSNNANVFDFTDVTMTGISAIRGLGGNDVITATTGADVLDGGAGDDRLIGGLGADTLIGRAGSDTFVFRSIDETGLGAHADHINDFRHAVDHIDLSGIDANTTVAGDQAFVFVGAAAFTALGQLRLGTDGGHIAIFGNVTGDTHADFEIILDAKSAPTAPDFVL